MQNLHLFLMENSRHGFYAKPFCYFGLHPLMLFAVADVLQRPAGISTGLCGSLSVYIFSTPYSFPNSLNLKSQSKLSGILK